MDARENGNPADVLADLVKMVDNGASPDVVKDSWMQTQVELKSIASLHDQSW